MGITSFGASQEAIDFLSLLIGLVIILYYAFLIKMVIAPQKGQRKPSKKMFLLGLIPFAIWIAIFLEEFSNLD
jgi:uncharacterized membrane-anchored protein